MKELPPHVIALVLEYKEPTNHRPSQIKMSLPYFEKFRGCNSVKTIPYHVNNEFGVLRIALAYLKKIGFPSPVCFSCDKDGGYTLLFDWDCRFALLKFFDLPEV